MTVLEQVETTLRVSEIFGPTIQGEGAVIGLPTVFLRLFGCDFRCSWCDSLHAVLPEYRSSQSEAMTLPAIFDRITELTLGQPILITLSGGNPALFDLATLIHDGHLMGYTFALETQGSVAKKWFRNLDYLTLSPKPPSSGMAFDPELLERCLDAAGALLVATGLPRTSLKVVVFDEDDFNFAMEVHRRWPRLNFYLQIGNQDVRPGTDVRELRAFILGRQAWWSQKVIEAGAFDVRVLPQLHVLTWGNARAR